MLAQSKSKVVLTPDWDLIPQYLRYLAELVFGRCQVSLHCRGFFTNYEKRGHHTPNCQRKHIFNLPVDVTPGNSKCKFFLC